MFRACDRAKVLFGLLLVLLLASAARRAVMGSAVSVPDAGSCPTRSPETSEFNQRSEPEESIQVRLKLRPLTDVVPATAPEEPSGNRQAELPSMVRAEEPAPKEHAFTRSVELELAGEAVVERTRGGIGALPTISADYRRHLGFERYVQNVREAGGRFFLYDPWGNRVLSEVDPLTGDLFLARELEGLSPRSRRIRSEPVVSGILRRATAEFGVSVVEIVLLLPFDLDAYLIGGMERAVCDGGMELADFAEFRGVYLLENGQLVLRIDSGVVRGGGTREFALRFSL